MSRFKKLVNILYYLMIVAIVLPFLLSINNVNWIVETKLQQYLLDDRVRLGFNIIGIITLIVLFIKMILTIFKKTDEKYLILFEEGGNVSISDKVIEKTVINKLKEFEEVIESTVNVKIKNTNDGNASVKVNIKCGLDEAVCIANAYHDFDKNQILSSKDDKKNKEEDLIIDKKSSKNKKETIELRELDLEEKSINSIEKDVCEGENKKIDSDGVSAEEIGKESLDLLADTDNSNKENLNQDKIVRDIPDQIKDAMNIISSEESNSEEVKNSSKEATELNESSSKNFNVSQKKIVNMGIDDLCNTIQVSVHNSLEDFLAQKVDKVNIKFYNIEIKEKSLNSSNKKKLANNKVSKKNKRVN